MQVLVVGGTGFIGQATCRALVDAGHDVAAFARNPAEADLPASVERVAGDVRNADDVVAAVEGRDAVYNLVALSPLFKPSGGYDQHFAVHVGGTENVVAACEKHDVDRLVQMSALGADPDGDTAYIASKGRAEEVVAEGDVPWTVIRPSVVFGEGGEFVSFVKRLTTPYVTALPGGGKTRFQPIWVEDIAGVLADALDARHEGGVYELGGPEVLTLADVTRLVYEAEGKSVTVLSVPMPLAAVGLEIAGSVPFLPFGGDQARSLRMDNTVTENDVTAFDRDVDDLRTLADYLQSI
ncbi:complex I NDUFA9 subunit family protein [Halocalculus aciditolerans]|uniref:NADH dehydrogenase n=1 Tax=Halocalculus aciditolerans TaxID=1383812 RepID=A0A830FFC8_9EURY|nr:complex I NDUFA9 subunit family protein [Halocalculus aciditolerans]GGL49848.1 NADH dehydrogenase [Halocalculus aciditolerans]